MIPIPGIFSRRCCLLPKPLRLKTVTIQYLSSTSNHPEVAPLSFAKHLFCGRLEVQECFPFPSALSHDEKDNLEGMCPVVRKYMEKVNTAEIDLTHHIPHEVLAGLGQLGLFGLQISEEEGGLGLSNTSYARILEETVFDTSITVTLMAHQSIGLKGIILFGSEEQRRRYLPQLASGEKYAAFALTEPSAGSDVASIKTRATLSADGKHYIINGSKQWITNGGICSIYTLFAKTKMPNGDDKITAFIVERGYKGLSTGKPENKLGIRGSNTTTVTFDDVHVPVENVLGEVGGGFKIAMKILNNGRFGMGSGCSSGMKKLLEQVSDHVNTRTQFGKTLKDFGLIQEKITDIAVSQYVLESMTYMTTTNIDRSASDREIEAAMCKVYGSERMWVSVNECIQMMGGMGFMAGPGAPPYERILRDTRILMIFEGTNEILRLMIALGGIQTVGKELSSLQKLMKSPLSNIKPLIGALTSRVTSRLNIAQEKKLGPHALHPSLVAEGDELGRHVRSFGAAVEALVIKHGKDIIMQQLVLKRVADIAMDLYGMTCVISRCSSPMPNRTEEMHQHELALTRLFVQQASRRIVTQLATIGDSSEHDGLVGTIATQVLAKGRTIPTHALGF